MHFYDIVLLHRITILNLSLMDAHGGLILRVVLVVVSTAGTYLNTDRRFICTTMLDSAVVEAELSFLVKSSMLASVALGCRIN